MQRKVPAIGIALLIMFAFLAPSEEDGEELLWPADSGEITSQPLRLTQMFLSDFSNTTPWRTPSLRGCRGEPAEFIWIFPEDDYRATVDTPYRTRLVALDKFGRRARPEGAASIRADLALNGQGRPQLIPAGWQDAELALDIETDKSETVQAEIRIESQGSDPLLQAKQIEFAPGPLHSYHLEFIGDTNEWITNSWLQATVTAHDRFGNPVTTSTDYKSAARITLRSDLQSLKIAHDERPEWGDYVPLSNGKTQLRVRSDRVGPIKMWVEELGSSLIGDSELKSRTSHEINFTAVLHMREWHLERNSTISALQNEHNATISAREESDRWLEVAGKVRNEFIHAWRGYRKNAWGKDELRPLSNVGLDNWGGMGMTILDSLTTLWILNLPEEFEEAADFVEKSLKFGRMDEEISVFELSIRGLGGLLGAHSLSGRPMFLQRARELADLLLPAFDTPSGMPLPGWNLKRLQGTKAADHTCLAEAGSIQLEWRYLSEHTKDPRYRKVADGAFNAIQGANPNRTGLLPSRLSSPDVQKVTLDWKNSPRTVGGEADSYYEYLLKQWLQNPDERAFKDLWLRFMKDFPDLARPNLNSESKDYKLAGLKPDNKRIWDMEHLACFAPGMVALGLLSLPEEDTKPHRAEWTALAEGLTASCAEMWTMTMSGLAPECMTFDSKPPHDMTSISSGCAHSLIRPETAESLYYLYRLTGDAKYREWGQLIFEAIVTHSKTASGFASVTDVRENLVEQKDEMQSFVMAETFKYLYLLFAPPELLDFDTFVLNTEGHPLRRFKRAAKAA